MTIGSSWGVMFPGQGSQSVDMLSALDCAGIRASLDEASSALGWDVAKLIAEGPEQRLNQTEFTQPALLAANVAIWREAQARQPFTPKMLAGHSLGEFAALVAAESLDFDAALRLVQLRGQLMQSAVAEGSGGMAAVIGLEDEQVTELCAGFAGGVLEPVNFNAPGQVVVAGEKAGLDWLQAEGKAAGARMVVMLPVSVPSHCSLMRGAAEQLGAALEDTTFRTPRYPVLHNLDAEMRTTAEDIRVALCEQMYRPVQWTQTLQRMQAAGISLLIECGPGKVLCGLARRAAKGSTCIALASDDGMEKLIAAGNGAGQ